MSETQTPALDRLQLTAVIVGQLALIAQDPALGYRGQALVQSLGLLSTLLQANTDTQQALRDLADQVKLMAEIGREPTKDEWYGLRDRSAAANAIFNPPPVEEPVTDSTPVEPAQ